MVTADFAALQADIEVMAKAALRAKCLNAQVADGEWTTAYVTKSAQPRPIGTVVAGSEVWGICEIDHKAHVLFGAHRCVGWVS